MKYFHWRDEAEEIKPGFNVYRLSCKHSAGFTLELDTLRVSVRYSKQLNRWFWVYKRRAPKVWRILKGEE